MVGRGVRWRERDSGEGAGGGRGKGQIMIGMGGRRGVWGTVQGLQQQCPWYIKWLGGGGGRGLEEEWGGWGWEGG